MDEPVAPPPPTRARRRARPVTVVVLALLPWTWYLWRNLTGGINFFSVAIPLLVALVTGVFVFAAIAARRWWPLIVAASLLLFGVSAVALPRMPQSSPTPVDPFRIASANVYDGNRDPGDAATAIAGTGAEVLISVETPNLFQDELAAAAGPSYRYGYAGPWFAVRSKFPVQPLADPAGLPEHEVAVLRLSPPGVPALTVFVVHALNPAFETSFSEQQAFIEDLASAAVQAQASGPVVIAGDLNLSDRTHGYRILIGDFRDGMRAGHWARDTYIRGSWGAAYLRIDHIFVSPTWCAENPFRYFIPGSDHQGVTTMLGPCPSG
ncbi:MAG TPA: endonuclease/exonuclease/phosphatase family protein [Actinomycetota bacterium]|nr:endonuclease/exonuclease/phosphatase family protein [Actinomycetota bacterium]